MGFVLILVLIGVALLVWHQLHNRPTARGSDAVSHAELDRRIRERMAATDHPQPPEDLTCNWAIDRYRPKDRDGNLRWFCKTCGGEVFDTAVNQPTMCVRDEPPGDRRP